MLSTLKNMLIRGTELRLGRYCLTLRMSKVSDTPRADEPMEIATFNLHQAKFLESKYGFLSNLDLPVSLENASDVLRFYFEIIPVFDAQSSEVALRNALHRLRTTTSDPLLILRATEAIAKSDLRCAIPDRAKLLASHADHALELAEQLELSDQAYGATLLREEWPDVSRGRSLCYYFEEHQELLQGKRVLHFSPEPELREWIVQRAIALGIDYQTSNLVGAEVDINQDLTRMSVDGPYDLVICHRVLEHVLDDASAFKELGRILASDGILQISVPQSMHSTQTKEWTVPDETHHEHVRHYGRDFVARMSAAGLVVEDELWLVHQSRQILLSHGAYPLRMYHARKSR